MKRMTYSRNPRSATNPLEKLSADICTINEVSADKSTMFLLVMDEFSRYKWAYLLKSKADASDHLKHLILKLEKKFKPLSVMLSTLMEEESLSAMTLLHFALIKVWN
ncbi:hypothetical protein PF005_g12325 [Phytophthora fragariae]|uniref:Integrase catalytic domain-containing protein n=1 Tax=Phytophthora fragariae TaxID=53985 RepID=A0A6A3S3Z6_9STRA|nr:hypothetical protein PF003_g15704 [Phytophthora fragariae]KAE8936849.1 hypothetical protein PF009_g13231 [Phytophthora fragariae]KAE8999438.1 hypothetical protein PF011_g14629 [Phytophthora fragariae]KAE9108545.1 hypothetical protein PF007_g12611 [Phytophthora fragariae]KAE9147180.1 hypothetical protein PF006_g8103 [Phytophthora fragariae]